MPKLTIKEIVDFARAGWKPQDVKDVLSMASDDAADPQTETGEQTTETATEETAPEAPEAAPAAAPEQPAQSIDYKSLYESEHEKLMQAQKQNVNSDMSGNKADDQETVNAFMRDFM